MVAAAVVGGAVIGAGASMRAADKQARGAEASAAAHERATELSVAEQRRQFDITRADFAPYRETGTNALARFGALYGVGREGAISPEQMEAARSMFMETPGYAFRFDEGVRALDRSAAARGGLRGGAHERGLVRYGQGIASDEFGNYSNALARLAGIGQSATGSTAAAGQASANAITNALMTGAAGQGNAMQTAATARASGYAGVGNAATGAATNYMLYDALAA